ncbi:Uncharacterised protein [Acinetobacter phage MD-2021a]|nr:Uncharacterised protein [Acinetobacter phage MD-2021a]CAH1088914.1 Uncharacterised protein [Acinetobacter phage MD-2021a]
MKISKEIYDLIVERYLILDQISSEYQDNQSMNVIYGCECGCGGDSSMDYLDSLEQNLVDVEDKLRNLGVILDFEDECDE